MTDNKLKLVLGRPLDESGRLVKEIRTYDLLDKLGIPYERIDHEAAETMEACEEIDKALAPAVICKNLLLNNAKHRKFYMLMIAGDKKFNARQVSDQINSSRLSFAPAHYMEDLLDITPGSLSVMGLMNDRENMVQLLVDRELLEWESFGCHPCINTSSLRMKTKDLFEIFLTAVHHDYIVVDI